AIARLDNLIKSYPNASSVPDALFYLGDSFHKTGQPEKAREYFTRLLEKNPDSPYRIRILQDYPGLAAVSLPTAR
ncbi:MAG TPA: tetratricopeptide repeat protein, partial [Nitrospiria bacterium]|nr:tetratricopeptide repeat protein [Nitrospiria bacterium]